MIETNDPRGPIRTIKGVHYTGKPGQIDVAILTFEECSHQGSHNPIYSYRVGDPNRCYECGVEARKRGGQ